MNQIISAQGAIQKDILLCTLNSTYQHSSFGLRYLFAQMQELTSRTQIIEWTIKENPRQIVEQILQYSPLIVGFGVYIWNTTEIQQVISILKTVSPKTIIILGGPEISHETESQSLFHLADHIITGEADFSFRDTCQQILTQEQNIPKLIRSNLPLITDIQYPYELYTDHDITNRVIYVEASRGCPYRCEYCLSSLDKSVRSFEINSFLNEIKKLIDRGARSFKFVDRTFNLSPTTSTQILKFFLEHIQLGLFLHFEMVPDRLPTEIRDLIKQFPEGSLQFEVGIQTLNPQVAANVSRKNDLVKVKENFAYIKQETHVHTHADLIVGLPGETLESFARGFNQLSLFEPDEIQVGILKRLKGTPIARHEKNFDLRYQTFPPYQILSTSTLSYQELQFMNRFAKFWDLYANSGDFKNFISWLKLKAQNTNNTTPSLVDYEGYDLFTVFKDFVVFLNQTFANTHSISLINLTEQAWKYMQHYLVNIEKTSEAEALKFSSEIVELDYCQGYKKRDLPPFLKYHFQKSNSDELSKTDVKNNSLNKRQIQHL